jgi:hypothetical protein
LHLASGFSLIRCKFWGSHLAEQESRMSQVENQQSFRGVKCLYCTQPIQISPLVAHIVAEQESEADSPEHEKCQIFRLRCMSCGKERPYKISEILEFEGEPPNRMPHIEPASSYLGTRSKAANG